MLLRNCQIAQTIAEGGRPADAEGAISRAFEADLSLFSSDRFHPSSAGYAVIASALLPLVLDAAQVAAAAQRATAGEQPPTPGVDTPGPPSTGPERAMTAVDATARGEPDDCGMDRPD